jgi:hypothetical protein
MRLLNSWNVFKKMASLSSFAFIVWASHSHLHKYINFHGTTAFQSVSFPFSSLAFSFHISYLWHALLVLHSIFHFLSYCSVQVLDQLPLYFPLFLMLLLCVCAILFIAFYDLKASYKVEKKVSHFNGKK